MFGFGKSAHEKAAINLFALQFGALGLPDDQALALATTLINEVLAEIRPRGIDPFKATQGEEYAAREQFTVPRLKAGLSINDIKAHWNRPLLVVLAEAKMREKLAFIALHIAEQKGETLANADRDYRRVTPQYGDPTRVDPSDSINAGPRAEDAVIYPEFAGRIETWRVRTPDVELNELIERHGTFNALVRHLVSISAL